MVYRLCINSHKFVTVSFLFAPSANKYKNILVLWRVCENLEELLVGLVFLPQNFGPVMGTYECFFPYCECIWGGGSICRWWGNLTTIFVVMWCARSSVPLLSLKREVAPCRGFPYWHPVTCDLLQQGKGILHWRCYSSGTCRVLIQCNYWCHLLVKLD